MTSNPGQLPPEDRALIASLYGPAFLVAFHEVGPSMFSVSGLARLLAAARVEGEGSREHDLEHCRAVLEKALAVAAEADPQDAPFPLVEQAALTWHRAQAEAFRHALEMLPSRVGTSPDTSLPIPQGWKLVPATEDVVRYVSRYGGKCRDCADGDGICLSSGLPCDINPRYLAIRHVIAALNYGLQHGYVAASPQPSKGESIDE